MQDLTNTDFPVGYEAILNRINGVQPVKYGRTRNFINGDVTRLSPYISRGVISVKQVMQAVLASGFKHYEIEKFLQELAWREYFQRVWQAKGNEMMHDLKYPQPGVLHRQMITAVADGKTEINAIDAAIDLLKNTGYMHNHLRMYTAGIACNIGGAYWLQPSRWMYYYLLDGDIASNTCSWQWVAGAFASKKYYCNQENINKYTGSHQTETYLNTSYEQVAHMPVPHALVDTITLKLQTDLPDTAFPDIDTLKPTLIYNSYNLDPYWRSNEDVNRVLLLEPSHFDKYPVSKLVLDFIIALSGNISGLQVYTGEVANIAGVYGYKKANDLIISKEHPAFVHYPGCKDERDWMFPSVKGYFESFFQYWKKCEKLIH